LEHEKETSSPTRTALWPLALLGTLGLAWVVSKFRTPKQQAITSIPPKTNPHDETDRPDQFRALSLQVPPSPGNTDETCKCCHHKTPWWKIALDVGTFLGVVVYSIITYHMWREMQSQTSVQQEAQRPWLGITSDLELAGEPFVSSNRKSVDLVVNIAYTIQNSGHTVALNEGSEMLIVNADNAPDAEADRQMGSLCKRAKQRHDNGGPSFLPGQQLLRHRNVGGQFFDKPSTLGPVWLLVCTVYSDDTTKIYYFKSWYKSANGDWRVIPPNNPSQYYSTSLRYSPITGFETWKQESD